MKHAIEERKHKCTHFMKCLAPLYVVLSMYVWALFQATLTLMGDDPGNPWRLLNIEILVSDPDTGGKTTAVLLTAPGM